MKTIKFLFLVAAFSLCFTQCSDDELLSKLDSLENKVSCIEQTVAGLNKDMEALQLFVDKNLTIKRYTQKDGVYTLILSDDTEITLNPGAKGEYLLPKIEIGKDGTWVIEGQDTGVNASGNTPRFRVSNDGCWEVSTGENGSYVKVLGEDGQPVKVTSGEGSDSFFSDVRIDGDLMVLTLSSGEEYSLPIVSDLTAKIIKEGEDFTGNTLLVTWGASSVASVKVKGESYFVTVPYGWKAKLSDPDADGNAKLTVTAPAAPQTKAVADNSMDLVISVNKGAYWAADKIQLQGTAASNTMLDKYLSGRNLIINGVEINKSKFPKYQHVEEDTVIPKDYTGVYFVEGGVSLAFEKTNSAGADYVIVIGNSGDRTANFSLTHTADGGDKYFYCNKNNNTDKIGNFVFHNVIFTMTNSSMYLNQSDATYSFVFDRCNINLKKKIIDLWNLNQRKPVKLFSITDCIVTPSEASCDIFGAGDGQTGNVEELIICNNIFKSADVKKVRPFSGYSVSVRTIAFNNNTIYNVTPDSGYIRVANASESYTCTRNIFYQSGEVTGNMAIFNPKNYGDFDNEENKIAGEVGNNVGYRETGAGAWQDVWYGKKPVAAFTIIENLVGKDQDPFAEKDVKNGRFIPIEKYKDYGAQLK